MTDGPQTPENVTDSHEVRHPYRGEETIFEDFLPFVHVGDEQTRERFIGILREIYAVTGNVWRPGWCYDTERLDRKIKDLKTKDLLSNTEFTAMNWSSGHYFMQVRLDNAGEALIIDPFGVDTPGKDYYRDIRTIIPFFGESSLASEHHQRIYAAAKPEDRAFYHFHP